MHFECPANVHVLAEYQAANAERSVVVSSPLRPLNLALANDDMELDNDVTQTRAAANDSAAATNIDKQRAQGLAALDCGDGLVEEPLAVVFVEDNEEQLTRDGVDPVVDTDGVPSEAADSEA